MDHCHGDTFNNFMVLKPKEVSLLDLFHLLYTGDICANKVVDCPDGTDKIDSMWRRWALVVSLFVQMVLLTIKTPLATFGSTIENWLNCFYISGNSYKTLFATIFKGTQVKTALRIWYRL
jgi:hypothetical protein